MAIKTAHDLFLNELRDIYSAEKQAVRAYPRITKAASSEQLKQALQMHLEQTKGQIERLDRVFEILEKRSGGRTCEAMKGLVEEATQSVEEIEKGPVLDVAIIAAGQRMEHYEIAAYGTVATLAEAMGEQEIKELLGQTLEEEKQTDQILTQVSQGVNSEALSTSEGEEDADEDGAQSGSGSAKKTGGSKTSSKTGAKKSAKKTASKSASKGSSKNAPKSSAKSAGRTSGKTSSKSSKR